MSATSLTNTDSHIGGPTCPEQVPGLFHCPACFEPYKAPAMEAAIQADFIRFARAMFPTCVIVHNSNNQSTRTAGARAKAAGVLAGMPDITIFAPRGMTLFIELKTKTGKRSKQQREVHAHLQAAGFQVATCYSLREAMQVLYSFLPNDRPTPTQPDRKQFRPWLAA